MFVCKLPTMLLVLSVFPIKKHITVRLLSLIPCHFNTRILDTIWCNYNKPNGKDRFSHSCKL